jgi:hypothetical protein
MKADMIKPGSIVAMRMCGATPKTIRDGTRAVPGIVLAVGNYRTQNQRWCGVTSIVEVDVHQTAFGTTQVAVLRPSLKQWSSRYPEPVEIKRDTEWVLDLVQPGQCYPWEMFDLAHDDYRMAKAERDAWGQRATVIRKEMEQLVHTCLPELLASGIITPDHLSLQWRWKRQGADELEAKLQFANPESPKNTADILRFEESRTLLADWLMQQCPQLVEEHRYLMDKIHNCRL